MNDSGIFVRGKLVGTKTVIETNRKTGEQFTKLYLGIVVSYLNGFGQHQDIYKDIGIGKEKQRDSAFMKSIVDAHLAIVEVPIGVGDYRNIFVDGDAVIRVLQPAVQADLKQVG